MLPLAAGLVAPKLLPTLRTGIKAAGKVISGIFKGSRAKKKAKKAAKLQAESERLQAQSESILSGKIFLGNPKLSVNNEVPEVEAQKKVFPGKSDSERLSLYEQSPDNYESDAQFAALKGFKVQKVPPVAWVVLGVVALALLFFMLRKKR